MSVTRRQVVQGAGAAGLALGALALALIVGGGRLPFATQSQQPAKVPRVVVFMPRDPGTQVLAALRQGLQELGYTEGQNVLIDYREFQAEFDRLPDLTTELVRLDPDVIVSGGLPAALALKQATTAIPIVAANIADPVGTGLIPSLARPRENITALTTFSRELSQKRLALLKEAVPGVARVGVLWNAGNPDKIGEFRESEAAAGVLELELQSLAVRGPGDFESALGTASREQLDALTVFGDTLTSSYRAEILAALAQTHLPVMYPAKSFVERGGLMSYGPEAADTYRRVPTYVDKILKGTWPGDLPAQQPMLFEFAINLKAAQEIGLSIPPSVLLQATEVIQ